jgi:hypothetical protein
LGKCLKEIINPPVLLPEGKVSWRRHLRGTVEVETEERGQLEDGGHVEFKTREEKEMQMVEYWLDGEPDLKTVEIDPTITLEQFKEMMNATAESRYAGDLHDRNELICDWISRSRNHPMTIQRPRIVRRTLLWRGTQSLLNSQLGWSEQEYCMPAKALANTTRNARAEILGQDVWEIKERWTYWVFEIRKIPIRVWNPRGMQKKIQIESDKS